MAFTYFDTLLTDRDKLRFSIGDSKEDAGPRPDNTNYSDGEIAFFLSEEDDRLNGAAALAFETLASEWESSSISEKDADVSYDAKNKAADFDKRAGDWRKKPGGAALAEQSTAFVTLTRVDEYTN